MTSQNESEALILALALAITARDRERAAKCVEMAEYYAQGMTPDEIDQCKAAAQRLAGIPA